MKIKRLMITGLLMLLAFMGGLLFWLMPSVAVTSARSDSDALAASRHVLEATGLNDLTEQAAAPALVLDTHGGFHGDGSSLVVFEASSELMASIAQSEGWHISPVTDEEYALLADCWFEGAPLVSPPPGTVFDAWFYRNDHPAAEMNELAAAYEPYLPDSCRDGEVAFSFNWAMAFYDADTGLMCYYRMDI